MSGDFSRRSVNRAAGYTGVLMQQGRVQLDADWNEQLALASHRTHMQTRDTIGCCGTPEGKSGFKIEVTPAGDDFFILPGTYYAGGLLCEIDPEWLSLHFRVVGFTKSAYVESAWFDGRPLRTGDWVEIKSKALGSSLRAQVTDVATDLTLQFSVLLSAYENMPDVRIRRIDTYLTQRFYPWPDSEPGFDSPPVSSPPSPRTLQLEDGAYVVYLEAWQREVNALEDPHLREVALGGPDTAERLQTVWQVKLLPVSATAGSPPAPTGPCRNEATRDLPEWDALVAATRTTGLLNARSKPPKPDTNPCILPPSAGYQGLENQLYRVEIFHAGASREDATFVWSRDNATVETAIVSVDTANANVITVADLGKDDLHSFAVSDWVEVVDRDGELQGAPRFLAQIVTPAPDASTKTITLSAPVPNPNAINNPGTNVFRLRRWDMSGSNVTAGGIPIASGWLPLEAGVEVSFGEGNYASRSYWLIPARTATADVEWPPFQVPNTQPVPQPPAGEVHHFCRLAQVEVTYGAWTVIDIREEFASLTTLTKLYGNLRFHKKYLHGKGVVCGLEVACAGGDASSVIVNDGYAIDCEGNDILICDPVNYNVIANITTPSGTADGDYSLYIDTANNNELSIEPLAGPRNPFAAAFEHTVWADFQKQYLEPLRAAWDAFAAQPANALVKNNWRAFSSLVNLFYQYVSPSTGSSVYISPDEHKILAALYSAIKSVLKDKTFCALLSGLREFPAYPADIGLMGTGFGKGFKTRLRLNLIGSLAVAVGNDNTIHLYRIEDGVPIMAEILTFPGDSSFVVADAGFVSDMRTLYAIASNGTDSIFAMNPLSDTLQPGTWSSVNVAGVVLKTFVSVAGGLFASGVSQGVYSFTPNNDGSISSSLAVRFNASGQLVDMGGKMMFAAEGHGVPAGQFDSIVAIAASGEGARLTATYRLPNGMQGSGDDDLAVLPSASQGQPQRIFVTAGASRSKVLLVNYSSGAVTDAGAWSQLALGSNDIPRFAFHAKLNQMLISFGNANEIDAITETPGAAGGPARQLSIARAFPGEVMPISLVANDRAGAVFALNAISNTITAIRYDVRPWPDEQIAILQRYRVQMLEAWTDLFAALVQYLKDGLCDLLVLKCRTCSSPSDDRVYLAGITVRNGRVYKVCNFSKRHYVKTFPGVEYWLSIVPILPVLETIVKEFCCSALIDWSSRLRVPGTLVNNASRGFTVPLANLSSAFFQVKNFGMSGIRNALMKKISAVFLPVADYASSVLKPPAPATAERISSASFVGKTRQQAQQILERSNVKVHVQPYDPQDIAFNVAQAFTAPAELAAGSSVTLFADDKGNVRSFAVTPVEAERPAVESDISGLKKQIANLQAVHARELAARDQQIARLSTTAHQLETSLSELKTQVSKIRPRATKKPE